MATVYNIDQMEIISSRQNPKIKEIKKLIADKSARESAGAFWVDGVNFVAQVLVNAWEIQTLAYVPELVDSDFKKKVIAQVEPARQLAVSETIYADLAAKKDLQGVGAVVKMKQFRNEFLPGAGVVLENLANPGNLGSIARLCAAFDIKNLSVIRPAVEFFHPEAVRASMGAIFYLNLVSFDSLTTAAGLLSGKPRYCLGTSLQEDSLDLAGVRLPKEQKENCLVWFGSEARGLTNEAKNLCQTLVRIPISKAVDSLNVAESAAIVLYELLIKR